MSSFSDGDERTICSNLSKAVPDKQLLTDIRTIVHRVHQACFYVSELLNVYIRQQLEDHSSCPAHVFDHNELRFAFKSVIQEHSVQKVDPRFETAFAKLPPFEPVHGAGLTQVFQFAQNNLAATAINNVCMHFPSRMLSHVRLHHGVSAEAYKAMTKEERKQLKLQHFRMASDMVVVGGGEAFQSDPQFHGWIHSERAKLHLEFLNDATLPLIDLLKKRPEQFMYAMYVMCKEREASGGKCFAIYPLRRHFVDRFIHLDERGLNASLQAMRNERLNRKRKLNADETFTFQNVIDPRACKLCQRWRLLPSFDTDGVSIHFKQLTGSKAKTDATKRKRQAMHEGRARAREEARKAKAEGRTVEKKTDEKKPKPVRPKPPPLETLPSRGIYAIDTIKHLSRSAYQVIGIDPGKHNLIEAVDSEHPMTKHVRYTLKERNKHMQTRRHADEAKRGKHPTVQNGEELLSKHNSRSASLDSFLEYCTCRRSFMSEAFTFYGQPSHRQRRKVRHIRTQKSEQKLYKRLRKLQEDIDKPLVLAYGSWGLTSSKGFKGLPPCIGKGLAKKLSKHFVLVPTPEHYTSKTCVRCFGECGPHPELKHSVWKRQEDGSRKEIKKEIRGLRVCQNESCKLFMNRDRMGACNIATNFDRLVKGEGLIRPHTTEEIELNKHKCLLCSPEN